MSNTLEYLDYLKEVKAKTKELDSLLSKELGFKLDQVLESYASLFNRFCPFKVGDRVQLKEDINPPQDSGWYDSRHFLVKGAIATVHEVGYRNDLFNFALFFDGESYIHYKTKEIIPVTEKGLYYLPETRIEKIND